MSLAFVAALLPVRGWIAVGITAVSVGYAGYRVGFYLGEEVGFSEGHTRGTEEEREIWLVEQAKENKKAAAHIAAATVKYVAEVERSTALQKTLAVTKKQVTKLRRERDEAIQKYVTGNQRCLSPDAVRVLNDRQADTSSVSGVPPASGSGATGTPTGGTAASDRDVAEWISDARERYSTCAAQVNSWVKWYEGLRK